MRVLPRYLQKIETLSWFMDIEALTQEMHRFVRAQGWYEPDSPRPQTLRNMAISLSLEAGEVLEHFQWGDQDPDLQALGDELADVALYLLQLASVAGVDLEQAILTKLERNYTRNWEED
jgi:NTP pyrophosphatase (non-canonical NTP hydrolase)